MGPCHPVSASWAVKHSAPRSLEVRRLVLTATMKPGGVLLSFYLWRPALKYVEAEGWRTTVNESFPAEICSGPAERNRSRLTSSRIRLKKPGLGRAGRSAKN